MTTHTLTRTGTTPLRVDGEMLHDMSTRVGDGPRWHEVRVIRSTSGRLVAMVEYRTQWGGETGHSDAYATPEMLDGVTPERDLLDWIEDYDPIEFVEGYPATMQARRDRQVAEIRLRWETLVSELADKLGVVTEVA